MAQTYHNFVAGKWVPARSGKTFESINPARKKEVLGIFPCSEAADVAQAVQAARREFRRWRLTPAPRRAEIMFRAAEIMVSRKEELAQIMTREMGKVLKESRGDVQEGIDMTYFIAGEGRRLYGETTPSELPDKFAMSIRVPVGVVAAITPWNFPLAIPTWKIVPALVSGNTVVFKPAEDTPLVATMLVQIFEEAGLPGGVLNLVHGFGEEAGAALVAHPGVDLVSFTGSCEVGQQVAVRCAQDFRRVSLEMGGKNAILIMEDADLDLAVEGAVWGACGTTGQRCTAASRLIVHKQVAREFTERFVSAVSRLRLGDGMKAETDVGPVINEAQLKRVDSYTQIARQEGASILCGGEVAVEGECAEGFFYKPTVFAQVTPLMRIAREEIFGPCPALLPVGSFEEALEVANSTSYGLSSAIYTRDVNRAFVAIQELAAGITYVNASTIGAEVHLPFGGICHTGNGHREGGKTVLDIFTEWKAVYVDYSGKLQKAQIDR
ncbi:MAG: aldehyde dehydrogenase family protein [Candidatus Tectomicrobia bacterium]|uniref:Aldehyde dehydrogenase family protein n=1 Tax=Tectimicrobiota bacterium TaxID=2528274 RepID=A0A932M043_UNCTE|nr:aldehyde dehydrogenase family protein [Candidatus Tectomicrobia bacterium]